MYQVHRKRTKVEKSLRLIPIASGIIEYNSTADVFVVRGQDAKCRNNMHIHRVATDQWKKFQPKITNLGIVFQPFSTNFSKKADGFPAFPASNYLKIVIRITSFDLITVSSR